VRRLALVAIVAGVVSVPAVGAARVTLSAPWVDATAQIAGWPVYVSCRVGSEGGYVVPLGHADNARRVIEVQPFVCTRLNGSLVRRAPAYSPASFRTAQAILVLVHEAVHLSSYAGWDSEALTECRAIQLVRTTALAHSTSTPTPATGRTSSLPHCDDVVV
jgi:hypothetical protein